jgi:hypothetical protein
MSPNLGRRPATSTRSAIITLPRADSGRREQDRCPIWLAPPDRQSWRPACSVTTAALSSLTKAEGRQQGLNRFDSCPSARFRRSSDDHDITPAGCQNLSSCHIGMYLGRQLSPARHVALCYTPIVHLDPLLRPIKRRTRALLEKVGRAGTRTGQALSWGRSLPSPAWTLVTPYCKRTLLPPFALAHALDPSGLGHAATLTRRPEGPPGLKTPTSILYGKQYHIKN